MTQGQKRILILTSLLGALSVIIGAFGAHGLEEYLTKTNRTETFDTAVKYQFYHVFALLAVGLLYEKASPKWLRYSSWCFLGGIVLFSGSLYALIATQQTFFGAITPIGGLLLIAGWVMLLLAIRKA